MLLRRPQPRQSESHFRRRRVVGILCVLLVLGVTGWTAYGQWREDRRSRGMGEFPRWELDKEMPRDVFTFARVEYNSQRGGWRRGYGRGGRGDWATDYPAAELNLAYRLEEMTSMKVHPEGVAVELTDPELFNYPFIYMVDPGGLVFEEAEVVALRKYLLNGGFLMVDDFWGEYEWRNFYSQIKRVFPDREPEDLPIDHPIFSCVFPLKEKPQIPNIGQGTVSQYTGVTWERPDAREPHYRAFFDDKGRMMSIICHNTDLGDGWEREGENFYYFREFSEKKAYPLGINILFYAMTQ
jgi:hypothetical protein